MFHKKNQTIRLYNEIFLLNSEKNLLFRRILPRANNLATTHLSDSANKINAMKLMVNLQVTAMQMIFEFFYAGIYMLVVRYAANGTSFATMIQGLSLTFVLLPFCFLMNTTENKYRIVEIGWKNVFKNVIEGLRRHVMGAFSIFKLNHRISTDPLSTIDNSKIVKQKPSVDLQVKKLRETKDRKTKRKSSINVRKLQSKISPETSTNETDEKTVDGTKKVFIVSEYHTGFSSDSNNLNCDGSNLSTPLDEVPTTSRGEKARSPNYIDSDEELSISSKHDDTNTIRQNEYQSIAQNILQIMKDSLEHETLYLRYFKKLLELKENFSNPTESDNSAIEQILDTLYVENFIEHYTEESSMKGQKSVRNRLRKDLLQKFEVGSQTERNEEVFELLMIELIDLEESFIDA